MTAYASVSPRITVARVTPHLTLRIPDIGFRAVFYLRSSICDQASLVKAWSIMLFVVACLHSLYVMQPGWSGTSQKKTSSSVLRKSKGVPPCASLYYLPVKTKYANYQSCCVSTTICKPTQLLLLLFHRHRFSYHSPCLMINFITKSADKVLHYRS